MMASEILAAGIRKATGNDQDSKAAQLEAHTKNYNEEYRITSDFGVGTSSAVLLIYSNSQVQVKQTNTDHWLKVVDEEQNGPLTLEDPFAREKVRVHPS